MAAKQQLFDEFPPVGTRAWEKRIKKDLRGADYKEKLRWETGEGVEALPFYRQDDWQQAGSALAAGENDWEIRQLIAEQDPANANQIARRATEGGADGITFWLRAEASSGLRGINIQTQAAFNQLLEDIDLTQISLHLDGGAASPILLAMLYNALSQKSTGISGTVLYDPFAVFLRQGTLPADITDVSMLLSQIVTFCNEKLPKVRSLGVDGRIYHESGGTIVQQVGFALAAASEYLARLSETGLEPAEVAKNISFNFSVGSNYFLEIAKLRAARKLWPGILGAYHIDPSLPMYVHASGSRWNKTRFDPYVNMLRSTTEGMSAAISACDAITMLPFDATFRPASDFSRRIARNSQIILKEEAYFNKVVDPAAGSYYVEILTDKIARASWDCFCTVEKQGGMMKAIQTGLVQEEIEKSCQRRERDIATRKRIFVGTNQYPGAGDASSIDEENLAGAAPIEKSDASVDFEDSAVWTSICEKLETGATLGDFQPIFRFAKGENIPALKPHRGAEAFEALRRATENYEPTPRVLTLPLGDKKMRQARSTFAVNFLGCAGYDITDPIGFNSIEEAITAVKKQQPDIVVLCSSDDEYKKLVPTLCEQLQKLDEPPIAVLAGYPREHIKTYKKAGIDVCIHRKSNVLKTLQDFQKRLGIIDN